MRVLFFMRSTVYARNFESTLRLLAGRGHQVHVVADRHPQLDRTDIVGRLSAEYPGITHGTPPPTLATEWSRTGYELRRGLDYLRYLEPEYGSARKLRHRAETKAPSFLMTSRGRRLTASRAGRRVLALALRAADRAVPRDPEVEAFVRAQRPDLVVVTPLVEPGSPQAEFLRAARSLGVRTALCVYSWDNLTNKGLIHDPLDLVTVWNDPMRREAIELHGVPPARVVVTGAAAYDHWFSWSPRLGREEFCSRVGLPHDRPYLLYLCSSKFIAPDEPPFITRWIRKIRAASPHLRDVGVLIRPHPQNPKDWTAARIDRLDHVSVWPRDGANPDEDTSRADYFDSIVHSAAVVGVNTSAQIESAVVGRGVYTVLAPEFTDTQEGTLHFHHLRNGGLLNIARSMPEHAAQLEAAILNPAVSAERCRRFVETFVRPHGIGEAAAPRLVAALEAVAGKGAAAPEREARWAGLLRPAVLRATAVLAYDPLPPVVVPRVKQRKKKRESRAAVAAEIPAGTPTPYDNYLSARDRIRPMQHAGDAEVALTPSERQTLAALEDLWRADPQVIASLRRHVGPMSVARHADYQESATAATQDRLDADLRRLFKMGDPALWVDEPSALGGFGAAARGRLYNDDTVRYFRVLSLLQDASVLKHFRGAGRSTVWEIGGGWGGFAYQFKRVCPNSTYLITAMPTVLLASAAYLMTLCPGARVRFYDPADPDAFWHDWDDVDFAFAPESGLAGLCPPSLELALDLGTLEQMTSARVTAHVERAYARLATYFFSICSGASVVPKAIERLYWPHPVSAPLYLERRLAVPAPTSYLLGWRRLHA